MTMPARAAAWSIISEVILGRSGSSVGVAFWAVASACGLSGEGIEDAGKEGGGEAEAAGDGEERAAIEHERQHSEKRLAKDG